MKSIPRAAMPVVRVLRRDVKRPANPWPSAMGGLRWKCGGELCCPMGLHPGAVVGLPVDHDDFPFASELAVETFWRWWDGLERADIAHAMDAIWGPK